MTTRKPHGKEADWETGALGRDLDSAVRVSAETERSVDSALALKLISIRLQEDLIEKLKFVASHHGIGYQPLIRNLLQRFVRAEMLEIARDYHSTEEAIADEQNPVARFFSRP